MMTSYKNLVKYLEHVVNYSYIFVLSDLKLGSGHDTE